MPDTTELRYGEAINKALRRILDEVDEAILFGEDVAVPGGVFGVTRGLRKKFGDRVFDTPISETAILGAAVGAALMGRRPIVEIMWADFSLVALDQLVNQAANARYVSCGTAPAPIIVRTQQGNSPGACAQHSQSLEALFLHVPGLRVAMPATAQDAHDVLLTAIHNPDPTIVIENRTLYSGLAEAVTDHPIRPPGQCRVRRQGSDATVVTWGAIANKVVAAADTLGPGGQAFDILDLVWLNPLDMASVLESVDKTRRLVIVHEANSTGGFGAELIARVAEAGAPLLAPPVRIATPDVRIPASPGLASVLIPDVESVAGRLRELAEVP